MVYFACRNDATTRRMLAVVGSVSLVVAALVVVLMGNLAMATASAGQERPHDLRGTVAVPFGVSSDPVSCLLSVDDALAVLGGDVSAPCPGGPLGGFSDVAAGAEVTVYDDAGSPLATSVLTGGVAEAGTVTFDFAVEELPEVDGYRFQVNARGPVEVAAANLADDGWRVRLDLR